MLEADARDALGDPAAAGRALGRALDLAEPDSTLSAFLLHPCPGAARASRPARHQGALDFEIRNLLPAEPEGPAAARPGAVGLSPAAGSFRPARAAEPGEIRVLRTCRPTCPRQDRPRLSLSVHTVRTHIRHLFAKLGAHGRTEAVARARALGLLGPASGRTTCGSLEHGIASG